MASSSDYHAIPITSDNLPFNPETRRQSRFSSLLHLSPSKALVIATTIVCITFAALHVDHHPLKQRLNQIKYRLPFWKSQPIRSVREDVCDLLRKDPSICDQYDDLYHHICHHCGLHPHTHIGTTHVARPSTLRAPTPYLNPTQTVREDFCDLLRKDPSICEQYGDLYYHACHHCGLHHHTHIGTTLVARPTTLRAPTPYLNPTQTVREDFCDSLRKDPYICEQHGNLYSHVCNHCGLGTGR